MEDIKTYLSSDEFFLLLQDPKIIAVFLTAGLGLIKYALQPKARIIWGISHGFTFSVPQSTGGNPLVINTGSVTIKNDGRSTAKNVKFYFSCKLEHYQVWPAIDFETQVLQDEKFLMKFDCIKADESLNIEVIHTGPNMPHVLNARAEEGSCKQVGMIPMRVFPKWIESIVWILLVLGIYQILVLLLKFF